MKKAEEWFALYGVSHKNRTNIFIHKICVPLIMLSVLMLFYSIPVPKPLHVYPWLNWATLVLVMAWFFYASLGTRILALMVAQSVLMYSVILFFELKASVLALGVIIFVIAWVFQFIGHKIEGEKPSFLEDLQFLLIGPAWVFRKIIGYS